MEKQRWSVGVEHIGSSYIGIREYENL